MPVVKCATYNAKVKRPPRKVVAFIRSHPEIDLWTLQEAHGYRRALANIDGFQLIAPTGFPLSANTALLIRDTLPVVSLPPLRMTRTWPRPRMPGRHPARSFTRATVAGVRVVSVHMPQRRARRGTAQLRAATAEAEKVLAATLTDGVPTLCAGDWNGKPGELGGILTAAGLRFWPSGGIDFPATVGVPVSNVRLDRRSGGSDHPLVTFDAHFPGEEPPMPWRVAQSLETLLAELNTAAPGRSKVSDGSIGDAAHASRASDHNPWVIKGGVGIVRARDFTHDPAGGLDCDVLAAQLAELIRAGTHPALRTGAYIIRSRRILSRDRIGEGWRPYAGSNPHDKHLHLSVTTDPDGFDTTLPWRVLQPEEEPMPSADDIAEAVTEAVWGKEIAILGTDPRETLPARQMLGQVHNRVDQLEEKIARLEKKLAEK